jgi:hypothetical protein
MRWPKHVTGMVERQGAYRVLMGKCERKSQWCRPRYRWDDIHTFHLHFINPISAHRLLDMKHVLISLISISMTGIDKKHKQQYHSTTSHTVQAIQYNTIQYKNAKNV